MPLIDVWLVFALGAWIGVRFVQLIPERGFHHFVITVTVASALLLLI